MYRKYEIALEAALAECRAIPWRVTHSFQYSNTRWAFSENPAG